MGVVAPTGAAHRVIEVTSRIHTGASEMLHGMYSNFFCVLLFSRLPVVSKLPASGPTREALANQDVVVGAFRHLRPIGWREGMRSIKRILCELPHLAPVWAECAWLLGHDTRPP